MLDGSQQVDETSTWSREWLGRLAHRRGAATALVIVLILTGSAVYGRKAAQGNDYGAYHAAAQAVLQGESVYEVASDKGRRYKYPPALAILISPFALLEESSAGRLWSFTSMLVLFASLGLCITMFPLPGPREAWTVGTLSFLCTFRPIDSNMGNGQANHLVLLFIALTVWLFVRDRKLSSGMALSAAIAFKVTPIFLAGYFVWKREWRALAGTALGLLALLALLPGLVLGPGRTLELTEGWVRDEILTQMISKNDTEEAGFEKRLAGYSLRAVVHQYTTPAIASRHWDEPYSVNVVTWSPGLAEQLYRGLALALLVVSLAVCGLGRIPDGRRFFLEFSIFVTLMVVVSPLSRKAHFIVLMVPFACVVHTLVRTGDRRLLWWLLPPFALFQLTSRGLIGKPAAVYALALGCLLAGTLVLWASLLWLRRTGEAQEVDGDLSPTR